MVTFFTSRASSDNEILFLFTSIYFNKHVQYKDTLYVHNFQLFSHYFGTLREIMFKNLILEVYIFLEATTIHGLAYLSRNQTKSTRIIWTLIVLTAFGIASYFLYGTFKDFDTKYTSTTIEDRSIKDYPFPAVTFDPGEFNSKDGFLRTFLNQFEFIRYEKDSPMRNNEVFSKFDWLVGPMQNDIFDGIEKFLLENKKFITEKGKIFRNDICILVLLKLKNKTLSKEIRKIFQQYMYKYRHFKNLMKFMKQHISPLIMETKTQYNLTKSEISTACKDSNNLKIKSEMEALLLSYMFLFIDHRNTELGAGDLATSSLVTGLSGSSGRRQAYYYSSTHKTITDIYNHMTNATLPTSILNFPAFFMIPETVIIKEYVTKTQGNLYVSNALTLSQKE